MDQSGSQAPNTTAAASSSPGVRPLFLHLGFPLLAPAALVWLYFTPVMLFGCVNRGLIATGITAVSLLLAVLGVRHYLIYRNLGDKHGANLWLLTILILLTPLFLLAGPLG